MTRPKNKPRYRIKRTDIFRHPKTRGMRAGSYALMDYAMAQNILGIARESPKSLASHFEGMTATELQKSIRCMVLRNVARWWPEYDILWIVECLDEQSFSEDSDRGALATMATLPEPVRAAVALRYGVRVEGGGRPRPSPPTVDAPQKSSRAVEQESLRDSPPVVPASGDEPANDLPGEESPGLLLATQAAAKPSKPRKRRGRPREDYPDGFDVHLLARLREACAAVGRQGPREITDDLRDQLRKLYAACRPTVADLDHVVAVRLAMTRRGEAFGSLTWDSICVASNFRRWLAEPVSGQVHRGRAEPAPRPTSSDPIDLRTYRREEPAT